MPTLYYRTSGGSQWLRMSAGFAQTDLDTRYVRLAEDRYMKYQDLHGEATGNITSTSFTNAAAAKNFTLAAPTSPVNCSVASNTITVSKSGFWVVGVQITLTAAADTYGERVFVDVNFNSATNGGSWVNHRRLLGYNAETTHAGVLMMNLTSGDTINIQGYQSTGATISMSGVYSLKYVGVLD